MSASLKRGFRIAVLALLSFAAVHTDTSRGAEAPDTILPLSAFPRETIAIETRSARRHVLEAWRAATPEMRTQGLMFVEDIRADQAMIFVYQTPQSVDMWMKNTLLPLDMLFADAYGCIVKLHEQARPGSLATIRADVPVALVVELKAGTARTLGIGVGDRVTRPSTDWPRDARPCAPSP
jgi:hypothetical protein